MLLYTVHDCQFLLYGACSPIAGYVLLILEVIEITHNDTPQSVGLLWTSDQPVAQTSTWQRTTLTRDGHPFLPGGIRTHNLSWRAAADLRLRPRDHWDRPTNVNIYPKTLKHKYLSKFYRTIKSILTENKVNFEYSSVCDSFRCVCFTN